MRVASAWLGWRSVRHRPGSVLGAAVVLTVSTALVSALAFLYFSADRQVQVVERYTGVPLVAVPEDPGGRISLAVADTLAELPEVADVVPEVTFPATVLGPDGRVLRAPGTEHGFGHGWGSASLTPFEVTEGRPPQGVNEVVVDRLLATEGGLAVGQTVPVLILGETEEYRISGIADPADGAEWRYQSALFFADSQAVELWGHGPDHAGVLGVRPAEGVTEAELRTAADGALTGIENGRYMALAGADRGKAERNISPEEDRFIASSMLTLLVWAAVIATGVVAGAIGLAVRSRSREIAVLRAVGTTPQQVRIMVAGEAAVLSAVALPVGLTFGAVLAGRLATGGFGLVSQLSAAFRLHYTASAILLTAVVITVSAQIAGLIAARHALRVRPSDALAEATTEGRELWRGRVIAGAATFGGACVGALALAALDLPDGTVDTYLSGSVVLLAVIGTGLLAPWLVRGITTAVRSIAVREPRMSSGLAVANVAFYHRRFASVAGPLLLGITLAGTAGALQLHQNWAAGERAVSTFASDFVVMAEPGNGFDNGTRMAIADLPGVASAVLAHQAPVDVRTGGSASQEITATVVHGDVRGTVDLGVVEGGYDAQNEATVLVTTYFADQNGLAPGDEVSVAGPDPSQAKRFRISGTYQDGFLDRQMMLSPAAAETIGIVPGWSGSIFVGAEPSAAPNAVRQELEALLPAGGDKTPFEIHDSTGLRQFAVDQWAEQNGAATSTVILIGAFLVLGAVNSVSVAQFDRKREFASMRMLGFRWRQISRVVTLEAALTVLLVFAAAVAVTLWIAALMALGARGNALSLLPEILPVAPVAALGGAALLLSVAGTLAAVRSVRRSSR